MSFDEIAEITKKIESRGYRIISIETIFYQIIEKKTFLDFEDGLAHALSTGVIEEI